MDRYPDLPTEKGSTLDPKDGLEIDRTVSGAAHGRVLWTAPKIEKIALKHPWLTDADRIALDAFYAAHRGVAILYASRLTLDVDIVVMMVKPPRYLTDGVRWSAAVELTEV